MNMNDYFTDWQVQAIPRTYKMTRGASGTWKKGLPVDGEHIDGVFYNRAAAERFFNITLKAEVTDAFVGPSDGGLTEKGYLVVDGQEHAVKDVVNVANQDEVYVIGVEILK